MEIRIQPKHVPNKTSEQQILNIIQNKYQLFSLSYYTYNVYVHVQLTKYKFGEIMLCFSLHIVPVKYIQHQTQVYSTNTFSYY